MVKTSWDTLPVLEVPHSVDDPLLQLRLLKSEDPAIRKGVAQRMGDCGEGGVQHGFPQSVASLVSDRDEDVQVAAILALGMMGQSGAVYADRLSEKIARGGQRAKIAAITSIGTLGLVEFSHSLEALLHDPDPLCVAEACRSLGRMGISGAAARLVVKLQVDDIDVAVAAASALGHLGAGHEALVRCLDHSHSRVRAAALSALSQMQQDIHIDLSSLVAGLVGDADGLVRLAAVEWFTTAGSGGSGGVEVLGSLLSGGTGVRAAAAAALGGVGPPARSLARPIADLLREDDEDTSSLILGAAGMRRKLPPELRKPACAAAAALAAMGPAGRKLACNVAERLESDDAEIRAACLLALGRMQLAGARHEDLICRRLADSSAQVAVAACVCLGQIAADTSASSIATTSLLMLLTDSRPCLRAAALSSLSHMGETARDHIHLISAMLKDRSWSVRASAIRALAACGEAGHVFAAVVCRMCLSDINVRVRVAAIESLVTFGGRAASCVEDLASLLEDPSSEVRSAAVKVLLTVGDLEARDLVDAHLRM